MDGLRTRAETALRSAQAVGLLVSVRDAVEGELALAAGADLIDIKEPNNGPLGAASPAIVESVLGAIGGRAPVSAALGELADWADSPWARCDWAAIAPRAAAGGLALAKLGLAGCAADPRWRETWRAAIARQPARTAPVAVVYADWRTAVAPAPEAVLQQAQRLGCRAVLVDTFDKTGGRLSDHWPLDGVADFVRQVRSSGQKVVLAGSLALECLPEVLALEPDYLAVRGAVCVGGRGGRISPQRVRRLARAVAGGGGA